MKGQRHSFEVTSEGTTTVYGEKRDKTKYQFKISSRDLEEVVKYKWCLTSSRHKYLATRTWDPLSKKQKTLYLHHLLVGKPPVGHEVDHKDRDTLNNTRENLRIVKLSNNRVNRKVTNKHGFPGLQYLPETNKSCQANAKNPWQARIRIKDPGGKSINSGGNRTTLKHLGVYPTKELAIAARREAEKKYFGEIYH